MQPGAGRGFSQTRWIPLTFSHRPLGRVEVLSNVANMTRLPAKVLSNEKRGKQYFVTVEIEVSNFRRSFNSLRFGDQIPLSGSCQDGTLLLRYYQDPGFKVGQQFPLWLIEFANREGRRTPGINPLMIREMTFHSRR
jgi:hypothetical protein